MKKLVAFLSLALSVCAAQAASSKKSKDTAFADTWTQNAKTYTGKKVTTVILDITDPGAIAENAPCAAIKVATGNTHGDAGGEIIALMPAKDVQSFVKKVNAVSKGAGGNFGSKINYPTHTPTFTTIEGENVIVFGDIPKLEGKKPSEILANQQSVASETTGTPTKDEKKPAEKKNSEKKTDEKKSSKKSGK